MLMFCVVFSGSNAFLYASVIVSFVGVIMFGCVGVVFCIIMGVILCVGMFVNIVLKVNKKEVLLYWSAYRKSFSIAARCVFVEAFYGFCLYKVKNFVYVYVMSFILFGELEVCIMSICVFDFDFLVMNWLVLFIMAFTIVVFEGDVFVSGMFMGVVFFMLFY